MTEHTLTLPWPPKPIHSNWSAHWRAKYRATKSYRGDAWAEAKIANIPRWPNAILTFTYHPPDKRRRDCQNIPHALKAAIDGISDAMGCDDIGFRVRYPEAFGDVVKGGAIVVVIKESE